MKETTSAGHGFDLLRLSPVRTVFRSPLFPYILQAAALALFIWLAVLGWGLFAPEGVQTKQFAKTNIVNLSIWGLWWPAMVWGAVLFGRIWCAVCPLELVANVTERLGRRTGVKQQTLKRWLRSGVLMLVFYALIQMLVAGAELHRIPAFTSIFLWSLLVLGGLVVLLRGAGNLGEAWRRLALPLVVVIAAGHMAKGLAKSTSWGSYLPMALKEPRGTETALAITAGTMDKPAPWMPLVMVSVLGLLLLAVMTYFGMRESRLADPETHRSRAPSIILVAVASAGLVFGWGFLK